MFTALISFFGGSAFRMIWGEVSAWLTSRQDHSQELERIRLQAEVDAAQHARNLEAIRVQAELGVQTIRVQGEADIGRIEAGAWSGAVADVGRLTGIWFVDVWNQSVRPMLATLSILVIVAEVARNGFVLNDWDRELVAGILGIYIADRSLAKRGK